MSIFAMGTTGLVQWMNEPGHLRQRERRFRAAWKVLARRHGATLRDCRYGLGRAGQIWTALLAMRRDSITGRYATPTQEVAL